jgi:hypothetical protein
MRQYIRLCPYVETGSPVMLAALEGIHRLEQREPRRGVPDLYQSPRVSEDIRDTRTSPVKAELGDLPNPPISRAKKSRMGSVVWLLLLDLPLLILLLTYAAMEWVHHVHDHYLFTQLQDVMWTTDRSEQEITYYRRPCSADDMTTKNGADLFLSEDATPEEAYEHNLLHGFSVFKSVLSPETATDLRNFVLSRNRNLTDEESIYVIENTNRYSFGLGTEEPSVVRALKELTNNELLQPAIEKILGPNPALIELTAITSAYGATDQYWHDDVIPSGSAINFGRTFGPSFSIFVQLQNTTKEMGATSACPGTHYCSDGPIAEFCDEEGFQLVNEDGHWQIGDGLLMNMNSYHRGAGHTDPDGPDRVMFIVTFVPQPTERAESRQMSQGITFSLRWDMWGHTWDDLAHADTAMTQPWATLRALGLYKPVSALWGIDYISGCTMRMASEDSGFRRDELDEFLERGGLHWLPGFLQGKVNKDENWYEFFKKTLLLCKEFVKNATIVSIAAYSMVSIIASLRPGQKQRLTTVAAASGRLLVFTGCAFLCFETAKRHVDQTDWAADIKAHHRYASTTPSEILFAEDVNWPSTFPTSFDVLFETRYGSRQLNLYNDFVNGHPGNRMYRELIANAATSYNAYPYVFQEASASYIIGAIGSEHGRFLYQAPDGAWLWMDAASAIKQTKRDLALGSSDIHSALSKEIRFLTSDLKYGIFRHTAMSRFHIAPFLKALEEKLFTSSKPASNHLQQVVVHAPPHVPLRPAEFHRLFKLPNCSTNAGRSPRLTSSLPPFSVYIEPFEGAWISEGDIVEGLADEYWYKGTVTFVSAHGTYSMLYSDGESNVLDAFFMIRPLEPYKLGEEIEVWYPDGYVACEVVGHGSDDTYNVLITKTRQYVTGFDDDDFRRPPGKLEGRYVYRSAY